MRLLSTLKNIFFSLFSFFIITLLSFVGRRIFLENLGGVYLGLNSLFANIITMLSLVELGIGTAILYSLYEPLAQNNKDEVTALVRIYAKLYRFLAIIVSIIGLILVFFIKYLVKEQVDMNLVYIAFFLYLFDVILSYLFTHKRTLLYADQKAYISTGIDMLFKSGIIILQIVVLLITKNYLLFILIRLLLNLINNILINNIVNKRYPYILVKEKKDITDKNKKDIVKNVKALFFHKIGEFVLRSTDNIVIAYFINLTVVGLYSNYYLIISTVQQVLLQVFVALTASIGNLLAKESKERVYELFEIIYFFNFWIVSLSTIMLYKVLNPFIALWLGKEFLLDKLTFAVLLFNFYITCMRYGIESVKNAAGVYHNDRVAPIIESTINLVGTIILVNKIGLAGIFIGTTISSILVPVWVQPFVVYRSIFNKPLRKYYATYLKNFTITLGLILFLEILTKDIFKANTVANLIINIFLVLIFVNGFFFILFGKRKEYKYLKKVIQSKLARVKN